jgi:hypothetical protein
MFNGLRSRHCQRAFLEDHSHTHQAKRIGEAPVALCGRQTHHNASTVMQVKIPGFLARRAGEPGFYQTPPDLVVKLQHIDIVDVILGVVLRPRVVYQREIKS